MNNSPQKPFDVLTILARQIIFSFRALVAREPGLWLLFQPYIKWDQFKKKSIGKDETERLVTSDTELVIDGFQGSANSFATSHFKKNQTKSVKVTNHMHSPTQIIQAINQKIAVLLIIREPVGATLSLTSRWSYVSVTQALEAYIGFYTKLKPYKDYFIISTFDLTTQHLDKVVEAVNEKFNKTFDLVDVAKANTDHANRLRDPQEEARRKAIKQKKRDELSSAKNTQLLAQAETLYKEFEACARKTVKP